MGCATVPLGSLPADGSEVDDWYNVDQPSNASGWSVDRPQVQLPLTAVGSVSFTLASSRSYSCRVCNCPPPSSNADSPPSFSLSQAHSLFLFLFLSLCLILFLFLSLSSPFYPPSPSSPSPSPSSSPSSSPSPLLSDTLFHCLSNSIYELRLSPACPFSGQAALNLTSTCI